MPTVRVSHQTSLPASECFDRLAQMLDKDPELRKLDLGYSCQFDRRNLKGSASGSQFKAQLDVTSVGSGSEVEISVDLPFHLGLVKGLVEKTLRKKIEALLG